MSAPAEAAPASLALQRNGDPSAKEGADMGKTAICGRKFLFRSTAPHSHRLHIDESAISMADQSCDLHSLHFLILSRHASVRLFHSRRDRLHSRRSPTSKLSTIDLDLPWVGNVLGSSCTLLPRYLQIKALPYYIPDHPLGCLRQRRTIHIKQSTLRTTALSINSSLSL